MRPREWVKTVTVPATSPASVVTFAIPRSDQGTVRVRGWRGFDGCNVWVLEGPWSLEQCQNMITGEVVEGVCIGQAATEWPIDDDTRILTVFYEDATPAGSTAPVTLLLREYPVDRKV